MSPRLLILPMLVQLLAMGRSQDESLEARRTSLAQLPLEKLLHVKQTLGSKHNHKGDTEPPDNLDKDETALPFRAEVDRKKKPLRRTDPWEEDGKGKDVSSIFTSTVTVLSFLAFGGYLLCLLCQSLRTQQAALPVPGVVTMVPTVSPAAIIGKKKRKRRSAEEDMTRTLHRIAEAYAAYSMAEQH